MTPTPRPLHTHSTQTGPQMALQASFLSSSLILYWGFSPVDARETCVAPVLAVVYIHLAAMLAIAVSFVVIGMCNSNTTNPVSYSYCWDAPTRAVLR